MVLLLFLRLFPFFLLLSLSAVVVVLLLLVAWLFWFLVLGVVYFFSQDGSFGIRHLSR